ncbi:MAG: hypothetical protein ACT4NV_18670 [Rhodoferax sp.]
MLIPTEPPLAGMQEEYTLPSAEALLAGTLALMTGHTQSECARQRSLMELKIVANLQQLARCQDLSESFRTLAQSLQRHWCRGHAQAHSLWHEGCRTLQ